MVADIEHQADIVLDQQHAALHFGDDAADEAREIVGLFRRHAGRRLVEQEIARLHHQGAADGDAPLIRIGKAPRHAVGELRDADPVEHRLGFGRRLAARQAEADAGHFQIVDDRSIR